LVLLAGGVIALGAAALWMPSAKKPPTQATPEVERIQVPESHAPAAATRTEEGSTGMAGASPETLASPEMSASPQTSASIVSSASATTVGSVAVAPPAQHVNGGGIGTPTMIVAAGSTSASASPSGTASTAPSAIGGGPPDLSDGGVAAAAGDAGVELGDGGAVPYPPTYLAAPVYGAPSSSTSSTGAATGGGGGGSVSVVSPRPALATSFLLTMSDADDPEHAWTSLAPYLHPSDVVVAHLTGAGPSDAVYMDWGDRVRMDAPLVQYLVVLDDAAKTKDLIARGVPMNVVGVGVAETNGVDAATLNALSSAAHGAGKKLFVSVSTASPVALAQVGARADVIELVLASSDATAAASEAASAAGQMRAGGAPLIFVRLPSDATSTSTASTFLSALAGTAPNVGVSIPYGVGMSFLGDLRSSP
jgi:hypothetical protein